MSLIPDIQDALADAIDALTTVPVDIGYPGFVQPEHIWVQGSSNVAWTEAITGCSQHEETGEVTVLCVVARTASEYATPRDRAFALADIVTQAVNIDRSLGGTVDAAWVSSVESQESVADNERQVGVTVRVSFRASVSG